MKPRKGVARVTPTRGRSEVLRNLDSERSVISLMLRVPEAVGRTEALLHPDDFFDDANRKVFEACVAVHQSRQVAEPVTVASELRRRGTYDAVGGMARLVDIHGHAGVIENLDAYAHSIREVATKRRSAAVAHAVIEAAYDPTKSADEVAHIAAGDRMSRTGRKTPETTQGGALELPDVTPWQEAVDGTALFDEIVRTLEAISQTAG
jgi:replicative DNA helicase